MELLLFFVDLSGKESACQCRRHRFDTLIWKDSLEEEMATHSSILAWEIPWIAEPGGLQCVGSQRVGHDWAAGHAHTPAPSHPGSGLRSCSVVWIFMFYVSL